MDLEESNSGGAEIIASSSALGEARKIKKSGPPKKGGRSAKAKGLRERLRPTSW